MMPELDEGEASFARKCRDKQERWDTAVHEAVGQSAVAKGSWIGCVRKVRIMAQKVKMIN